MNYSRWTLETLQLELKLREEGTPIWKAVLKELESRCNEPPDMSHEPAVVEILTWLNARKGK